jgi:hypothetical protein
MSEAKGTFSLESETLLLSSGNQEPPQIEVVAGPICVAVGDRFEKRGRRVINWQVNAIAHPPHGSPIVTFAEIDGTARVQLHVADILEMGFYRIEGAQGLTRSSIHP